MSLKQKFDRWAKTHANPFTSELVKSERIGNSNMFIELAENRGGTMQGVSIWKHTPEDEHSKFRAVHHDLNQPFHDREEAEEYYEMLKQKLKDYDEISEIIDEVGEDDS